MVLLVLSIFKAALFSLDLECRFYTYSYGNLGFLFYGWWLYLTLVSLSSHPSHFLFCGVSALSIYELHGVSVSYLVKYLIFFSCLVSASDFREQKIPRRLFLISSFMVVQNLLLSHLNLLTSYVGRMLNFWVANFALL